MLSENLQSEFFKSIPSEFEVSGTTINYSKRYSNQLSDSDLPAIVVSYVNSDIVNYLYLNNLYTVTNTSRDSFTIEEGKSFYEFDIDSAYKIDYVDGRMNGEWGEIDDSYYMFYRDDDECGIIFDTIPDYGTECNVDYYHRDIRAEYGGEFSDRIQIDVINTNYTDGDKFINGLRLNKYVVDKVKKELMFGLDIDGMVVRDTSDTRNMTNIVGEEYRYRNTFDIIVAYHDTYTKLFNTIEEVNYELESQVV